VLLVSAVIQVTLSVVRTLYLEQSIRRNAENALEADANAISQRVMRVSWDPAQLAELGKTTRPFFSNFVISIFDQDRKLVSSSHQPPIDLAALEIDLDALNKPVVVSHTVAALAARGSLAERGRVVVHPFVGPGSKPYILAVATDYVAGDWVVKELSSLLVITTPIGLLAALITGWLIAGVAVRPIERLGRTAQALQLDSLRFGVKLGGSGREIEELQGQLNQALFRIDQAYEAQSRFITNVSHELRTPIATLLTESQTLAGLGGSPEDVQRFVRSAQEEMRRLGRLIESFLLLARMREGQVSSTLQVCSVNDVVVESVQACQTMARTQGIKLVPQLLDYDTEQPPDVLGDPDLLRTMLDNVLRNAIRFSPKGKEVQVDVRERNGSVVIGVTDSGPGIPDEFLPKMFSRYSQARSESAQGRGTGLGLSIAQGVAELHKGNITVANLEAGGCRFEISLPKTACGQD
jgi:signal transduction histidine kinase